ncbi:hypothetical protein [Sphingopyxis sp. MSC1_008]|jgi:hypothetical protein|nr:hypothetical protein [Sphingopyxis sp. MSC1_008]
MDILDQIWPLLAATGCILAVILGVHIAKDKLIAASRDPADTQSAVDS